MLRAVANIPEYIGSFTYANLPAASAYSGYRAFCSDLGANGCDVRSNGTRWRPVNGRAILKDLGAQVTGITNSETIVIQTLLPANAWQANDTLRIWMATTKSGTTDAGNMNLRIGTAGTTLDTALTGLSAFAIMAAGGLNGGEIFDVKLISATSAQKLGCNGAQTHTYVSTSQSTAIAAPTTISSAASNPLYVSVSLASAGTTNTVAIAGGQIELITP